MSIFNPTTLDELDLPPQVRPRVIDSKNVFWVLWSPNNGLYYFQGFRQQADARAIAKGPLQNKWREFGPEIIIEALDPCSKSS